MAPCSVCPGPRLKQARELTALTGMPKNLFTLDHRKEKGIPPSRLKDQSILQVPASSLRCCSGTCRLAKLLRTKSQAGRGFCAQFATCDNLPAVAGQRAHATKEHGNGCKEHRPQSVVVLAGKQEFVEAFSTIHQVSTWNAHQHNASSTMAIASLHKQGALLRIRLSCHRQVGCQVAILHQSWCVQAGNVRPALMVRVCQRAAACEVAYLT